jgi:hypothetical protein
MPVRELAGHASSSVRLGNVLSPCHLSHYRHRLIARHLFMLGVATTQRVSLVCDLRDRQPRQQLPSELLAASGMLWYRVHAISAQTKNVLVYETPPISRIVQGRSSSCILPAACPDCALEAPAAFASVSSLSTFAEAMNLNTNCQHA